MRLARADVDLVALVRESVDALRQLADRSAVGVHVDTPDHLVAPVDEHRIRQVVDNLVSNAIKYSPAGGTVTVALQSAADTVELTVEDTGIGIPADEVGLVFDRFFRGSQALASHIPGTGLGLDIVSSIVAAHGGQVSLDSEVGRGTTFRVVLPPDDSEPSVAAG